MNKKVIIYSVLVVALLVPIFIFMNRNDEKQNLEVNSLEATVLENENQELTLEDKENTKYKFKTDSVDAKAGDVIVIEYTGVLDKSKEFQDVSITNFTYLSVASEENNTTVPDDWKDDGIFSKYYSLAYDKLKEMTLDEKIGQIFLVRYPDSNATTIIKNYAIGGYIFFEKDFKNKTEQQVKDMISTVQKASKIPLLTAVDEEGGTVVRVSSNPNLVSEKFKSPSTLYNEGGFDLIKQDTINKSKVLNNLGLNLNLAPVVDVTENPSDYMYSRALGKDTALTSTYAKTVINASKGTGVSYALKHFPGYGNNVDTHNSSSTDTRTLDSIKQNDLPPFQAGIDAGAEAVLISHNVVTSIDPNNPASLSKQVHNILRNDMNFTGVIITDSLDMGATSTINDAVVKAVQAGNDLIIVTDYANSINEVKTAIDNGIITEQDVEKAALRVLAWKYYKGIMFKTEK